MYYNYNLYNIYLIRTFGEINILFFTLIGVFKYDIDEPKVAEAIMDAGESVSDAIDDTADKIKDILT